MLKVGIIGAGRMGSNHANNLSNLENVQLTAVYDINPEQSRNLAAAHPTVKIMNSPKELTDNPEVDLIVIASPTYCHKEGLLPALATGKPVFCEKPLCRTREDLEELTPLIRNYSNMFAIGFVRRYSSAVITMKKMLDEGKLGKLICGSVCCLFGGYKRLWGDWFTDYDKSGGVMLDMLAHHCDLQNYIVGKPVSVYAQAMRLAKDTPEPRDYVSCTAVFNDNYICNMECSWLRGGPSDTYMTVYGEKGALKISDSNGLSFFDIGGAETKVELNEGILGPLTENISGGMYATEMAVIADCAVKGTKPFAGAEDAIRAMEFCLGMMESAETGKIVKF